MIVRISKFVNWVVQIGETLERRSAIAKAIEASKKRTNAETDKLRGKSVHACLVESAKWNAIHEQVAHERKMQAKLDEWRD